MHDAGVDSRDECGKDAGEACWANQRLDAVGVAATSAEPAAVLHRDGLIETERLDVRLLLLWCKARVIRVLLFWAARGGEEECVDEDGRAEQDEEARADPAQCKLEHHPSFLHPPRVCRILADPVPAAPLSARAAIQYLEA